MTIAITDRQKEELNGQGFTVIERVLDPDQLARVTAGIDEVADQLRQNLRNLTPASTSPPPSASAPHRDPVKLRGRQ